MKLKINKNFTKEYIYIYIYIYIYKQELIYQQQKKPSSHFQVRIKK